MGTLRWFDQFSNHSRQRRRDILQFSVQHRPRIQYLFQNVRTGLADGTHHSRGDEILSNQFGGFYRISPNPCGSIFRRFLTAQSLD